MNDIIYSINDCQIYNYAADNTICAVYQDLEILKATLHTKSEEAIDWFNQNAMVANPDKF